MSSREDVKNIMQFCKHLRNAIIDEQKAPPDYEKLLREAEVLSMFELQIPFRNSVERIISQEKAHKRELLSYFDSVCPKMAFHRKGLKLFDDENESFDPSGYGAVITSEGIYTRRRPRRR